MALRCSLSTGAAWRQMASCVWHVIALARWQVVMIERIYVCTLSYYHHQLGSMHNYPLFRVKSWNNGMRCMSFYILMNLWCGRIASWNIRVLVSWWYLPRICPPPPPPPPPPHSCYWHAPLLPCEISYWWLTPSIYVLTGIFSRQSVPGRRVSPLCLHKAKSLRQGLCKPHAGSPLTRKQNLKGDDPALHLNQARGLLNWHMGLPALLGGNLGCRIIQLQLILHSLWGVS